MNTDINEKIQQAQRGIMRLHKIDSILKQLQSEQIQLARQEHELKAVLAKENDDIQKLENTSLTSIFYSILGSLDEHVEKERKDILAAKLKLDQNAKDLQDIHAQIAKLSAQRPDYLDCQQEFDKLYALKKDQLLRANEETAQKILELSDAINLAKNNLQEIAEAIAAGREVLAGLERVKCSLDKAEGWGTLDLLGGGLITGLVKHSHIDDAKAEAEDMQRLLRQFRAELTDIDIRSDIAMKTEGFAKFADFFLDGLIADWFMQSSINESQSSVYDVEEQVSEILERLEQLKADNNATIARVQAEITELVINA